MTGVEELGNEVLGSEVKTGGTLTGGRTGVRPHGPLLATQGDAGIRPANGTGRRAMAPAASPVLRRAMAGPGAVLVLTVVTTAVVSVPGLWGAPPMTGAAAWAPGPGRVVHVGTGSAPPKSPPRTSDVQGLWGQEMPWAGVVVVVVTATVGVR